MEALFFIVLFTLLSGLGDAFGFVYAGKVWEGEQFNLMNALKSAAGFTLGATFYSAWALSYAGRHAEARELLELEHQPGVEIAFPQWFARVKGSILRLRGDYGPALAEFQRAMTLIEDGPRADWERMRIFAETGFAEQGLGNLDAAYTALTRARELFERVRSDMHPLYAETLVALGRIELARGHADLAAPVHDCGETRRPPA